MISKPEITEVHFSIRELSERWGLSAEKIRLIFQHEPGVLKIGNMPQRGKRVYRSYRIPRSVAERVHQRLSNPPKINSAQS